MGPVNITGDFQGGIGVGSGTISSSGKLAGVSVGGSLVGGSAENTGLINSIGDMGPVKITGSVRGGTGQESGTISSSGKLAGVTVGGSLLGGTQRGSGEIFSAGDMGKVSITGSVLGGSGVQAGTIFTLGNLAGVSLGGSLVGGSADFTGAIQSNRAMGAVQIGGNVVGGNVALNSTLDSSGYIQSKRIASVAIGGSLVAGRNDNADTATYFLKKSGSIRAQDDLGPVTLQGSLVGNPTNPVIISARGQAVATATDLAIKSLTVNGRVDFALILAGYDADLNPLNADAQIGAVKVALDWIASSLAAGVTDGGDGFGNGNDALIAGGKDSPGSTPASPAFRSTAKPWAPPTRSTTWTGMASSRSRSAR